MSSLFMACLVGTSSSAGLVTRPFLSPSGDGPVFAGRPEAFACWNTAPNVSDSVFGCSARERTVLRAARSDKPVWCGSFLFYIL
jgi:hypothetical protein